VNEVPARSRVLEGVGVVADARLVKRLIVEAATMEPVEGLAAGGRKELMDAIRDELIGAELPYSRRRLRVWRGREDGGELSVGCGEPAVEGEGGANLVEGAARVTVEENGSPVVAQPDGQGRLAVVVGGAAGDVAVATLTDAVKNVENAVERDSVCHGCASFTMLATASALTR